MDFESDWLFFFNQSDFFIYILTIFDNYTYFILFLMCRYVRLPAKSDGELKLNQIYNQLTNTPLIMFLKIKSAFRLIGAFVLTAFVLNAFASQAFAQGGAGTLKGIISDTSGPIVGAAVFVKGTQNGVSSDFDGSYALSGLNEGDIIVFSLLGYDTQEITWTGQAVQNVLLRTSMDYLDEVVVVGYGVQKKINLTGSVSTVEAEELDMRPVANITQSLQGLVPGLTVTNSNSGRPGAKGTLQIRGQGNLSGTSTPYVLVDGVEMDLADVNPNDVASISVLKDASASAIYGARAAYGVILVTTKSGEEGKMRVSYHGNAGWTQPTVLPDMANSVEFANFWNDAARNANSSRLYSDEKIAQLQQFINNPSSVDPWADLGPNQTLNAAFENTENGLGNTDYFDLHYKDFAFKQDHNLSLSGGTEKVRYYVSGGAYTEDGILRYADIDYKRFNINASINAELTKWLRMKFNTKYSHQESNSPFGNGGLSEGFYHSLARFRPTVHYLDPNGNFTELSLVPYLQSGTYTNSLDDDFLITGGLEIEPVKNWKIFADYTYKQNNWNYKAMNQAPTLYEQDGVTTFKGTRGEMGVLADGAFRRDMDIIRYQSVNIYSTYNLSVKNNNFTFMLGFQEEDYNYNYLYGRVTDLATYTNTGLNLGMGEDKSLSETRNGWATRGFFGRFNYDYDGRYLLEVSARYDGSSRFAKANRWGFFPSVSVGWNIAREPFFEPASHIFDELKIRASWGQLGNQAGAALYTFASTMATTVQGSWYFQNGRDMYFNAPGVIDPNTTWEKVDSKNIALDWNMLKGRLTGSLEFFQRDTRDMLGPAEELPDMFGATAPQTNNARMRNRGWEFSVLYRGQIANEVDFSIGGSVYDATAVVTEYSNPTGTNPAGNWYTGREVGEIWGYRSSGIIQTQEEADEYNKLNLSYLSSQPWMPGDVKYLDLNGDNKIDNGTNVLGDMGDREIIGSTTPRYNYTIQGSLAWKGISLSVMFQGVGKRDWAPSGVYFWGSSSYAQVTVFKEHLDYWTPENTDAYFPRPYTQAAGAVGQYTAKTQQTCDYYLQNAAYCRLKNLTLSYDFPQKMIKKIGLTKLQVYFSGDNLVTFTKLAKMFDPEAVFTGNSYNGEAGKNYPMNRIYSVGLIINL